MGAVHTHTVMKTLLLVVLVTLMSLAWTATEAAEAGRKGRGRLVHMVSFKFKDTATAADIKKVEDAFAALPGKIPQIVSYEAGTNVSPEKFDKGFTHGFLLTFHSAKDRDDYLVHPAHKEFGAMLGPYLADVFVIDFWTHPASAEKAGKAGKAGKAEKPARKP